MFSMGCVVRTLQGSDVRLLSDSLYLVLKQHLSLDLLVVGWTLSLLANPREYWNYPHQNFHLFSREHSHNWMKTELVCKVLAFWRFNMGPLSRGSARNLICACSWHRRLLSLKCVALWSLNVRDYTLPQGPWSGGSRRHDSLLFT